MSYHYRDGFHDPEVEKWCIRMMSDPEYYENYFYKEPMSRYNDIIKELQEQYEHTPIIQWFARAKIERLLRIAKRELLEVQLDYDEFKENQAKTAISP
jgi:hypothetical protein